MGEITIGEESSVALAAPVFADIEIGTAFVGCPTPMVSEALAEYDCLAGEGSVGGEEPVAEGPGIDRLPGRPDGEAGFSETRSVCTLGEVSFAGKRSVAEGKGTEDGKSVTGESEDKDVLSAVESVWMPREVSVNGGKSVAMGSLLIWGAFTVAVAPEASVDSDTSVDPGTKV